MPYKRHLVLAFLLRLVLVCYGEWHDSISHVPYTDVDYKVFTDAARNVLDGLSPYNRHTYRYSPIIAYISVPNVLFHHTFGKILFCAVDILVGLLVRKIVTLSIKEYETYRHKKAESGHVSCSLKTIDYSLYFWIYNPLTFAISTRGNCDSVATFVVLTTLYLLQFRKKCFVAGLIHGIAVHLRLYPIVYSLAMFMYLSKFSKYANISNPLENKLTLKYKFKTAIGKGCFHYIIPNVNQLSLICGAVLSFCFLTFTFYSLYGYSFIYETYLYHLIRKDTRHNFSLFFYLQYLTAATKDIGLWQKVLTVLPQVILLVVFSVHYGLNRLSFNFSIVAVTVVVVAYNTVLTSQYFLWILSVLPLCLWQLKMSVSNSMKLLIVWFLAQAAWLLPAYLLEFHGMNLFLAIWLQGMVFFCINIIILARLIKCFMASNIY